MSLAIGQVLNNRYRIVKLLGQGGFGTVYKAWDLTFDTACALKENTETRPEARRQFEREARLLRALRHPNLPQVTDYVPGQGQYPGGASPYGAWDMSGKVWEWTVSRHAANRYVLCGGSWKYDEQYVRAAGRIEFGPRGRYLDASFRGVR